MTLNYCQKKKLKLKVDRPVKIVYKNFCLSKKKNKIPCKFFGLLLLSVIVMMLFVYIECI